MIVAKCDPAFAKAEGEKLRKAFEEATTVHVLSTRFNEPSEEVVVAWYKANGIKKTKEVFNSETWGMEEVECDTDDEDGWYSTDCTDPKMAASTTKLFLEEGKTGTGPYDETIVTVEPGTCTVFDPNTTNAYIMDGNSNNANAIWLRNWREVGLENARKTGGWCIQVLVHGGPSEMQRAEESMARSEGVPVIKLHLDKEFVQFDSNMEPYVKALLEAMKTKPKAEVRTITYYPEAVELTKVDVECMQTQAEADAMFAEIDTDGDGFITRAEVIVYITKQGGTEEQANGTFDELDTDKDGKLTKEEFRAAF